MSDDCRVVPGSAGQGSAVSRSRLNIAANCSLGHLAEWQDVADRELRLLAHVDESACIHPLGGNEGFVHACMLVRILELDFSQGGPTTGIVNDLLDDSP